MKICIVQTKSSKGNIKGNIQNHIQWIKTAIMEKADLIIFPELSLTGYEPTLAKELATCQNDVILSDFQKISSSNNITIGVGLPTKSRSGLSISMIIFYPNQPCQTYSKQILHPDETLYFTEGKEHGIISIKNHKVAPAICYESLKEEHIIKAKELGADIYLASVAKSQSGIAEAYKYFPVIAKKYSTPILLANCIGYCDNFESVGQSAIWNEKGNLIGQLDNRNEGILIYDTEEKRKL